MLSKRNDITAILTFNDLVAFGIYQACEELEYSIPNDISVIGFDDIPLATLIKPSLSTLRTDKRELGHQAMQTLVALINNDEDITKEQIIQPALILRDSG